MIAEHLALPSNRIAKSPSGVTDVLKQCQRCVERLRRMSRRSNVKDVPDLCKQTVPPLGLEPRTHGLKVRCANQLRQEGQLVGAPRGDAESSPPNLASARIDVSTEPFSEPVTRGRMRWPRARELICGSGFPIRPSAQWIRSPNLREVGPWPATNINFAERHARRRDRAPPQHRFHPWWRPF